MDGLDDLTDKEKETLRLIVRGHDAKSMASELELSVHTINERLRTARRKLAVTSSKEAARLLFESEGGTYENLADKDLGGAGKRQPGKLAGEAAGRSSRRILAGVLVMMTLLAAGLILASQLSEDPQQPAQAEAPANDAAAIAAASEWLALSDAGDWQASFDAAGKPFQEANSAASWAKVAQAVRAEQGAVVSREVLTVRYLNAPPSGFMEVVFSTRYAAKDAQVLETVTLQQEDGVWKVVGIMLD